MTGHQTYSGSSMSTTSQAPVTSIPTVIPQTGGPNPTPRPSMNGLDPAPHRLRKRAAAVVAIVILGGGLAAVLVGFSASERVLDKSFVYYTVKSGDLPITVTERGTLESQNNVEIVCEVDDVSGDGINGTPILWIIANGAHVKKGDLLVELDSTSHLERRDEQVLATERAKAQDIQATSHYQNRLSINTTTMAKAELNLKLATLAYQQYEDNEGGGTYQINLQNIELAITKAEASKTIEARNLNGIERLYELGYKGRGDLYQAELKALSAENELKRQEAKKNELMEFLHAKKTKQLKGNLESAKRAMKQVQANNDALLRQAKVWMDSAKRRYDREKERLERYSDQLKNCKIYAPQDGMVAYAVQAGRRGNTSTIAEGEAVRERQPIMTLPDLQHMQVNTSVHESVIDDVKAGEPTTVRLDAFPDRVYSGTVKSVAVLPDPGGWFSSNIKVYRTVVTINDVVAQLKPGMTAVAEIHTAHLRDVLTIPVQGVVQRGKETWCYISRDNTIEKQAIQVGRTNDKYVQITEGLNSGDVVVLNPTAVLGQEQNTQEVAPDVKQVQDVSLD